MLVKKEYVKKHKFLYKTGILVVTSDYISNMASQLQ